MNGWVGFRVKETRGIVNVYVVDQLEGKGLRIIYVNESKRKGYRSITVFKKEG